MGHWNVNKQHNQELLQPVRTQSVSVSTRPIGLFVPSVHRSVPDPLVDWHPSIKWRSKSRRSQETKISYKPRPRPRFVNTTVKCRAYARGSIMSRPRASFSRKISKGNIRNNRKICEWRLKVQRKQKQGRRRPKTFRKQSLSKYTFHVNLPFCFEIWQKSFSVFKHRDLPTYDCF